MAQPNKPGGKMMSSRLSTMKFMQRAGGDSPSSSSPATPSVPSAKRQRLTNGSYNSTPASTPRSEAQTPANGDDRSESEILRGATDRQETEWYLSVQEPTVTQTSSSSLRIVSAGYSQLDATKERSSEDEDENGARPQLQGRRSFGRFNAKLEKQQGRDAATSSGSESSDDDNAEDEVEDPSAPTGLIARQRKEASDTARAERKAKRKADESEANRMAEERRKKHVKLNNPSSISNGGRGTKGNLDMVCHNCGQKGHAQRLCPTRSAGSRSQGGSRRERYN